MTTGDLLADALALRVLEASVIDATEIGSHAVEYGINNWAVIPLRGKVPAISGGRGVLDATTDVEVIARWWGGRYSGCNIGARVPEAVIVIDVDPRHGGQDSLAALEAKHGKLPETLTTISGRGDGGRHLFFRRPPGKLTGKYLGPGIDLKGSSGYVVMPPSIHPDSGRPYVRIDADVAAPPPWLSMLLAPQPLGSPRSTKKLFSRHTGPSIADRFASTHSWSDILVPHGWRCLDADPDADGARWVHPSATSPCSATVRHGCLFVYSTNTPFDVTTSNDPKGYTPFRAYSVLDHRGDLNAAARSLTKKAVF